MQNSMNRNGLPTLNRNIPFWYFTFLIESFIYVNLFIQFFISIMVLAYGPRFAITILNLAKFTDPVPHFSPILNHLKAKDQK